jgi:hypothetical protein
MTEGDLTVARFVADAATDESLRNLREGSERQSRELDERGQAAWPPAGMSPEQYVVQDNPDNMFSRDLSFPYPPLQDVVAEAQYVDNPNNLPVIQAEQAYGVNVNHRDDIGLAHVVGDNGVIMAAPFGMGGGNKRKKSKKRKSKRRKSKKKMRRTKKYKR